MMNMLHDLTQSGEFTCRAKISHLNLTPTDSMYHIEHLGARRPSGIPSRELPRISLLWLLIPHMVMIFISKLYDARTSLVMGMVDVFREFPVVCREVHAPVQVAGSRASEGEPDRDTVAHCAHALPDVQQLREALHGGGDDESDV